MPGRKKPIDYGQFGQNFIEKVVTAERINAALGPAMKIPVLKLKAGPAGIAEVQVAGTSSITDVKTVRAKLPEVWFKATAVMGFQLTMALLGTEQKYHGTIQLALAMHVQTFDPLTIFLEVSKVAASDVEVTLEAENAPAEIFEGTIHGMMPAEVVKAVNEQLGSDDVLASRTIDVLALIPPPGAEGPGGGGTGAPGETYKRGDTIEGAVRSGEEKLYGLSMAGDEDSLEIRLYAKLGGACDEGIYTYLQVLDAEDAEVEAIQQGANSTATFDRYDTTFFPTLHESEGGQYRIRVTCEDGYKVPVQFKVALK